MKNKYYSLVKTGKSEADLVIYGDIAKYGCEEAGDVNSYNLSKQLKEMNDVSVINVHINSYGGDVSEGLAIYNSLKNHKAKVKTYCDGFACSIASVIFMAGDERIMSNASLLMIHNAWMMTMGNSKELRKQADDLDKITQASVNAYMEKVNISEDEIKKLLDEETWLEPNEALEKGFATSINKEENKNANQSVKKSIMQMIIQNQEENPSEDDNEEDGADDDTSSNNEEETSTNEDNSNEEETETEDEEETETEDEEETEDTSNGDEEKTKEELIREKNMKFFGSFIN